MLHSYAFYCPTSTVFLINSCFSISMFVHIMSKPPDLDQMRMGYIRNNSVDKKIISNRENIYSAILSSID